MENSTKDAYKEKERRCHRNMQRMLAGGDRAVLEPPIDRSKSTNKQNLTQQDKEALGDEQTATNYVARPGKTMSRRRDSIGKSLFE